MPSTTLPSGPSLVELAEDYLAAKELSARADDPGNSTRARRADLCRWARAMCTVTGRPVVERPGNLFDLAEDLAPVGISDLSSEVLLRALASMRATYETATVARSLATLRGLCRHLLRRGFLVEDPTDDDLLIVRGVGADFGSGPIAVRAFTVDEVQALRDAAAQPTSGPRVAWPRRDVAVVELLAGCGTRASETCALELRHVDDTF